MKIQDIARFLVLSVKKPSLTWSRRGEGMVCTMIDIAGLLLGIESALR